MPRHKRYEVFETTGYLIDWPIGKHYDVVGSVEWDGGPLTTWYVWDGAYFQTVSEHRSKPEANKAALELNRLDEEWDREQEALRS